jgi:heme-degrading monooxygenase HmoA
VYIAMNRFRVAPGHEADFESIWAKRKSYLDSMPGFREFHLLRGPTEEGATLYASHSVWASYGAFQTWCVFRGKPSTCSDRSRPLIPIQVDQ